MPIIPVDQARAQTRSFDMSQDQVVNQISTSIDANSMAGAKSITVQFRKSAVSQQEMEGALTVIRDNGYAIDMLNSHSDPEQFFL